jgi:hypothetical protein
MYCNSKFKVSTRKTTKKYSNNALSVKTILSYTFLTPSFQEIGNKSKKDQTGDKFQISDSQKFSNASDDQFIYTMKVFRSFYFPHMKYGKYWVLRFFKPKK